MGPRIQAGRHLAGIIVILLSLVGLTIASLDSNTQVSPLGTLPKGAITRFGLGTLNEVSVSPDGSHLAVASGIGVRIHDTATLQPVQFLATRSPVLTVAYQPGTGSSLAAGLKDGSVEIWHIPNNEPGDSLLIPTIIGTHLSPVGAVRWSPNGSLLASGSEDGQVRLWDVANHSLRYVLSQGIKDPYGGWTKVAFSPNGTMLAANLPYGHPGVWAVQTGQLVWQATDKNSFGAALGWLPDGSSLVVSGSQGGAEVWDIQTAERRMLYSGYTPDDAALSPDGRWLAVTDGLSIAFHDLKGSSARPDIKLEPGIVARIAWLPDNRRLITTSQFYAELTLWDTNDGILLQNFQGYMPEVDGVTRSPYGNELVAGAGRTIYRWDTQTRHLSTIPHANNGGQSPPLVFTPDGHVLISNEGTAGAGLIYFRDVATSKELGRAYANRYEVSTMAISPDGTKLATGTIFDADVFVFDTRTHTELAHFTGPTWGAFDLAWAPDSNRLATLWADQSRYTGEVGNDLIIWDTTSQQKTRDVFLHDVTLQAINWLSTGSLMALGIDRGQLSIWNMDTQVRQYTLALGWGDDTQSLGWSRDGSLLAIATDNDRILVWNVNTHQLINTFAGHNDRITGLDWSPDNLTLASSSRDGTVLVWRLER